MSELLPTREQALQILYENHCSIKIIKHCKAVTKLALEVAQACRAKGFNVNLQLVEIGALLHDVGRSKTHTINHALVGAEIAKVKGLPDSVVAVIKRHVGGGITDVEAEQLGWPKDVYTPVSLEEKIVSYADKRIESSKRVPIELTILHLSKEIGIDAARRVEKLNQEITGLIGDCP